MSVVSGDSGGGDLGNGATDYVGASNVRATELSEEQVQGAAVTLSGTFYVTDTSATNGSRDVTFTLYHGEFNRSLTSNATASPDTRLTR
jgi:hypothetical protein